MTQAALTLLPHDPMGENPARRSVRNVISRAIWPRCIGWALAAILFCRPGDASGASVRRDAFATSPFEAASPRWCERYHHAHYTDGVVRFTRSSDAPPECSRGEATREAHSCTEIGCGACARDGSPCAKIGDPNGNAILETARDEPGSKRSIIAEFEVERQLPVGGTHIGIYVALHAHCHTTVQGLLVPDRPGVYHLNLAAFNQYIGGDEDAYRRCREKPLAEISPPLAEEIEIPEGRRTTWTLQARLDAAGHVIASSAVRDSGGVLLGAGRHTFAQAVATSWFGVAGGASRYAFGAQLGTGPSPSGGEPAVLLRSTETTTSGPDASLGEKERRGEARASSVR
jgi:hypothetical protein